MKKKLNKDKKIKKQPTSAPKSQNEFGVILEDINSKFDVLVEGQKILTGRMDRLEGEMKGTNERIDRLEDNLNEFKRGTEANFRFQSSFCRVNGSAVRNYKS